MDEWKILIVDDEPNNLKILQLILQEHYSLVFAKGGQDAIDIAVSQKPDLILLDIMMPEMDGYQVCRILKQNPVTKAVPVIFVTAMNEVQDEKRGFDLGAVDFLRKPVSLPIVQSRVRTHLALYHQQRHCLEMVRQKTEELAVNQSATIAMLGEAGHYNDTDTGVHVTRMAAYASAIALKLGWDETDAERLESAAPLHDMGKIGISDKILKKPAKLDEEEWRIMKRHPYIGYKILSKHISPLFEMAAEIALNHHEKWDGTGYPGGRQGEEIPESARIVAVADVFDALSTKRPYKKAWSVEECFAEIRKSSDRHFDPRMVDAFTGIEGEIRDLKIFYDKQDEIHE